MTTYLTADHHFLHENILSYCNRPFNNAEEMQQYLIQLWNDIVCPDDEVYYLGDLTMADIYTFEEIVSQLNGHIYIIPGNHDKKWVRRFHRMPVYSASNKKVILMEPLVIAHTISKKAPPTLCHYPMREWFRSHHGCLHFHGHSHGNLHPYKNSLDVGIDNVNKLTGLYKPLTYEQAVHYATTN